jgi:uncharacterized protein (DUF2236 family)
VHAALVHTSLQIHERRVRRLTIAEQRGYYEEQRRLVEVLGVPRERLPDTLAGFDEYLNDMLESERIAVTAALRDVVDATLRPDLPFVARPLTEALRVVTVGLLPQRLREELGLSWGPATGACWRPRRSPRGRSSPRSCGCCATFQRRATPRGGDGP